MKHGCVDRKLGEHWGCDQAQGELSQGINMRYPIMPLGMPHHGFSSPCQRGDDHALSENNTSLISYMQYTIV